MFSTTVSLSLTQEELQHLTEFSTTESRCHGHQKSCDTRWCFLQQSSAVTDTRRAATPDGVLYNRVSLSLTQEELWHLTVFSTTVSLSLTHLMVFSTTESRCHWLKKSCNTWRCFLPQSPAVTDTKGAVKPDGVFYNCVPLSLTQEELWHLTVFSTTESRCHWHKRSCDTWRCFRQPSPAVTSLTQEELRHLTVFSTTESSCHWPTKDCILRIKPTKHFKTKSSTGSFQLDLFYLLISCQDIVN